MAALVVREHLRRAELAEQVTVSSAGIEAWCVGGPADARTEQVLAEYGYPTEHVVAQLSAEHLAADLLVAMDSGHERVLKSLVSDPAKVRMLRSFITPVPADLNVPDPYLGGQSGFYEVMRMIEAATPGLIAWLKLPL